MFQPDPSTHRKYHRLLLHGESVIASAGLGLAAALLAATAAAGWWALDLQQERIRAVREASLSSVGVFAAEHAAEVLEGGDARRLQPFLQDVATQHGLIRCRLLDAEDRIVLEVPGGEAMGGGGEPEIVLRSPVVLKDGNHGSIELAASGGGGVWRYWGVQAGLGAVGAVGGAGLLLAYRILRRRLRALNAIREAIVAMRAGEGSADALAVSQDFGPEAQVWNDLLAERESLRRELMLERARESLGPKRDVRGDLVQACDAMWQGLILVDESLKAKYANGAAATFLRTKRDQIVGADLAALVRDPKVIEAIRSVATGAVRRRTTEELRRAEEEGGGILRFSVRPVRRDDSAAAIVMIEDVTQQRVADEARNAFVAQATHELRTPLTNIRLYVEQALEEGENDAAMRSHCLNVINQESRRLERIVADMLSVAEIEAGSLKVRDSEVRLETVFEELEADYRAQAVEKSIDFKFELPPKYPLMQGDRDKIVLALHNLVGNALKYTPNGGCVTVRVDADEARLQVDVTDTGIGIGEEETELIFEKFYRSKDRRVSGVTGSGLGLALAREVVRLHGGDITVRSKINEGSTFTLTLPTMGQAA